MRICLGMEGGGTIPFLQTIAVMFGQFRIKSRKQIRLTHFFNALAFRQCSQHVAVDLHECGHGFYSAFEMAWATHGSVILSPDDVWLVVQLQFCKYMDGNAEELRNLFVDHKGTVELNIEMESADGECELFMERTMSAIQDKCKANVTDAFLPVFSSATKLSNALQRLDVMDCMQKYFTYRRCYCCGIERVGFEGTLADWQLLRTYVLRLKLYHLAKSKYFNSLDKWVEAVVSIIDHFIIAFIGETEPSLEFWNSVIQIEREQISGGSTYVQGWINTFLVGGKFTGKIDVNDIPAHRFNVPVTVDNNGQVFRVRLLGGFTGVEEVESNVYRPQTSMVVIKVGDGEEPGGRVNPSKPKHYAPM